MSFTLEELGKRLGASILGDGARVVSGVATLDSAGPSDISFLTDLRYKARALESRAGAFLAPEGPVELPAPSLRVADPRRALADLLLLFHPPEVVAPGVHPAAVVSPMAAIDPTATVDALAVVESGATIGARVRVGAFVYVGKGVSVGAESLLYPHVVIREGVSVGARVILHPGVVLGGDGFGFVPHPKGHKKIPQVGGVVIEDDVEIGANTTIDRAMLGVTRIARGTKIDNLVQIAHNVQIGEGGLLAAQVGLSGSVKVGKGVIMAGQVGVADHVDIGDGAILFAQAGVAGDVPAGGQFLGAPARPAAQTRRVFVALERLPELLRETRALARRLEELERRLAPSPPSGGDGISRDP